MNSPAPWLWLIDFDAADRALDATEWPTGEFADALEAHFAEVRAGPVSTVEWPNATFDCIALHDALVRRGLSTTEMQAELKAAHRLLKPGGWLALSSPSPPRLRRPATPTVGIRRMALTRLLTLAHFRETRCLFVSPSADDPTTVVPDSKPAIRARDLLEGVNSSAKWKHRAALELGFRPSLFPAYVLLARA